jgi:hypothetical protein
MTEFEQLIEGVREAAARRGLFVWEDVPGQVPFVDMPPGSTTEDMLDAAVRMGVGTIYVYLDDEEGAEVAIAGFAKEGIFHRLIRAADQPLPKFDEDQDEEDGSFWARAFGPEVNYDQLSEKHQGLVDAILSNEDYDPYDRRWEMEVLEAVCSGLDEEAFGRVKAVADWRFREQLDDQMDSAADRLATRLAKDPSFDPLLDEDEQAEWVSSRTSITERRIGRRVVRSLQHIAHTTGLWEAAHDALSEEALAILDGIPADVRDRLGFTTRTAARAALLEPYLSHLPAGRRDQLSYRIARIDEQRDGIRRQRRYASAAAALMDDHGESRAATGRILGISSTVIDRLLRDQPNRVDISEDEVLVALDPRLGKGRNSTGTPADNLQAQDWSQAVNPGFIDAGNDAPDLDASDRLSVRTAHSAASGPFSGEGRVPQTDVTYDATAARTDAIDFRMLRSTLSQLEPVLRGSDAFFIVEFGDGGESYVQACRADADWITVEAHVPTSISAPDWLSSLHPTLVEEFSDANFAHYGIKVHPDHVAQTATALVQTFGRDPDLVTLRFEPN